MHHVEGPQHARDVCDFCYYFILCSLEATVVRLRDNATELCAFRTPNVLFLMSEHRARDGGDETEGRRYTGAFLQNSSCFICDLRTPC